jgi:hypothetical protein
MTTNLEVIGDALREINVISEVDTPSAEQGSYALRRLNQMMELWKEQDIEIGWFAQTKTGDTIPIPDWCEMAVTNALAILIAPKYGATVSAELVATTDIAVTAIKRKSISEKLDNADMSHLPEGAGWRRSNWDIITDSR